MTSRYCYFSRYSRFLTLPLHHSLMQQLVIPQREQLPSRLLTPEAEMCLLCKLGPCGFLRQDWAQKPHFPSKLLRGLLIQLLKCLIFCFNC